MKEQGYTWGTNEGSMAKEALAATKKFGGKLLSIPGWIDDMTMRKVIGVPLKAADKLGLVKLDWDSPDQKDFMYHNWWATRDTAAGLWSVWTAAKEGHFVKNPGGFPILNVEKAAEIFRTRGLEWAKDNPDEVDSLLKIPISPLWFTGPLSRVVSTPFKAAQIKALEGLIDTGRATGKPEGLLSALAETYGAPLTDWAAHAMAGKDKLGKVVSTAKETAEYLYGMGYRSSEAMAGIPKDLQVVLESVTPKFFRNPYTYYSSDARDVALNMFKYQDSVTMNAEKALEQLHTRLPFLTNHDVEMASEVLLQIGRPKWLKPEDVIRYVEWRANSMIHSGEWAKASKYPAPNPDQIRAAAIGAEYLKAGWRPAGDKASYVEKYLPVFKEGLEKAQVNLKKSGRKWQEEGPRKRPHFKTAEEYHKALAKVFGREPGADLWDGFRAFSIDRIKYFNQMEKAVPGQATRWREARQEILEVMRNARKWKKNDFNFSDMPQELKAMAGAAGQVARLWHHVGTFFKKVQLNPATNPGWVLKNLEDSLGTRNLIASGFDPSILFMQPNMFRANGQMMGAGPSTARSLLGSSKGTAMDWIEERARKILISYDYNRNLKAAEALNIPFDVAEPAAHAKAIQHAIDTHIDYGRIADSNKIVKEFFPYVTYAWENAKFVGRSILEYPGEFAGYVKAKEMQEKLLRADRQGRIAVGDHRVPYDQLLSFSKVSHLLTTPSEIPTDDLSLAKILKTASIVAGPVNPVIEALARPSDDSRGQSFPEILASAIPASNALKAISWASTPNDSTAVSLNTGMEYFWGDKNTDARRMKAIQREMAAAAAAGEPISREEGERRTDSYGAIRQVSGSLFGVYPEPNTKGYQIMEDVKRTYLDKFQGIIDQEKGMGHYDNVRALEISRKDFYNAHPEIHGAVPDPDNVDAEFKVRKVIDEYNKGKQIDIESMSDDDKSSLLFKAPLELYAKLKDSLGITGFKNPFVGEAYATEGGSAAKVEPDPLPVIKRGKQHVVTDPAAGDIMTKPRLSNREIQDNAKLQLRSIEWQPIRQELDAIKNTEAAVNLINSKPQFMEYVKTASQAEGGYWAKDLLNFQRDPYGSSAPPGVKENRRQLSGQLLIAVQDEMSARGPEAARKLWENIKSNPEALVGAVGRLTVDGGDTTEARIPQIHQKIWQEKNAMITVLLSEGGKAYKEMINSKYPGNAHYERHLISSLSRNQEGIPQLVDEINSSIKAGETSPDFWTAMRSNPGTQELYERTAIADHQNELRQVASGIALVDQQGRFVKLNPPAVFDLLSKGGAPFLSAMREGYAGPTLERATEGFIQDLVQRVPGAVRPDLLRAFDHNAKGAFIETFDMRTGVRPTLDFTQTGPGVTDFNFPLVPRSGAIVSQDISTTPTHIWRGPANMAEWSNVVTRDYISQFGNGDSPTAPSLVSYGMGRFLDKYEYQDANGNTKQGYVVGQSVGNLAQGVSTLGNIAVNMSGDDGVARDAFGGLSTSLGVYGGLAGIGSALGIAALGGPVGIGIAAAVGIASGFLGGGKRGDNTAAAANVQINRERLELERERFSEQLKQQSIRDIRQREQDLVAPFRERAPSPQLQERLDRFRVRPTFASRLGMVDAVERELGSALKPRW